MKLYKYLPPERIDILEDLRIRFTQPIVFNDPFESNPHISNDHPKEHWRKVMEFECDEDHMSENEKAWFCEIIDSPDFESRMVEAIEVMKAIIASETLALSLSEKADDLLMWAHYAKHHEGFVIGFDGKHPMFKGTGEGIYTVTKVR